jgi:hypothetical protein
MTRETRNLILFILIFVLLGVVLWYGLSVAVREEVQGGRPSPPAAALPDSTPVAGLAVISPFIP